MPGDTAEDFANSIELFVGRWEGQTARINRRAAELAFRSVTVGSAISGAPGQPVKSGQLLGAWGLDQMDRWNFTISIDPTSPAMAYAGIIEDGIRAGVLLTLRSAVGGFHSLKLTAAAWQRFVDLAAAEEAARG